MQHEGNVTVARGHLGVVLPTHHGEEIAGAIHEAQCDRGLVGVVTVDGQVDVGREGLGVVHSKDPLVDQDGLVLETEGDCCLAHHVIDLGHLSGRRKRREGGGGRGREFPVGVDAF